jgi:hypothetical protein
MVKLKLSATVYTNPFSKSEQPIGNPQVIFQKHLLGFEIVVQKFNYT